MYIIIKYFYQKRIRISFLGLFIGIFGLILAMFYRPYIYSNSLYDFHFADTLGSIFCIPSSTLFCYGILTKLKFKSLLFFSLLTYVLYELTSSIFSGIDIYDNLALFTSAIFTFSIYILLKYIYYKKITS